LLAAAATPLSTVIQPVHYTLDVTDLDEQHLERPIEGMVRIQPDLEPRVTAGTNTHYVLPTAKPKMYFNARDDHAVAEVWFTWEVVHDEKSPGQKSADTSNDRGEQHVWTMKSKKKLRASVQGDVVFDLLPLKLVKGDSLRVTFHARDYRGPQEGKPAATVEPILFLVTDVEGIFASMNENDKMVARELKMMTQRQLGIGDNP